MFRTVGLSVDWSLRKTLLARGRELIWHPPHMRVRYEHWVNGLAGDWLVSRQRFFGVPIPLWYPLSEHGEPDYYHPLLPTVLPMDPSTDTPPGYAEAQRGKPGGFIGEPDVLDTWATSTLTPTIAGFPGLSGTAGSPGFNGTAGSFGFSGGVGFEGPMDLRPQGPEIIRTWLFGTVVRYPHLPWKHAMINGWILDPDRKKMSKSVGNVVTPLALLHQHSPDAVRYWAACANPGTDTAFDTGQMRIGCRLAMKILNAAQFVLGFAPAEGVVTHPLDRAMLDALSSIVDEATTALTYTGATAPAAVSNTRLPTAEEGATQLAPDSDETTVPAPQSTGATPPAPEGDGATLLALAAEAIAAVRKAKSVAHTSMRTPVARLTVHASQTTWARLQPALPDLRAAGVIATVTHCLASGTLSFTVELGEKGRRHAHDRPGAGESASAG